MDKSKKQQQQQSPQTTPQHPHPAGKWISYFIAVVVVVVAVARVIYGFMLQKTTLGSREDCLKKRQDLSLGGVITGGLLSIAALVAIFRRSVVLYVLFMVLVAVGGGAQFLYSSPQAPDADDCAGAVTAEAREKEAKRRKGLWLRRLIEAGIVVFLVTLLVIVGARSRATSGRAAR